MDRDILKSLGVKPSRSKGQNFLQSPAALDDILSFASISKGENIVEIGPGLGVLTAELLRLGSVTAIEVQAEFCEHLRRHYPQLNLIEADVLAVDFSQFKSGSVLLGNLPYSLSTHILFHVLGQATFFSRAIFLLQKEFVARLAAEIDTSDYGVLSIMVQSRAEVLAGPIVSGQCFLPKAKVDSQVVELRFREQYQVDYDWLHTVVQAAFHQRRKKIFNVMQKTKMFRPDILKSALEQAEIDPEARPETVAIANYVKLANLLNIGE